MFVQFGWVTIATGRAGNGLNTKLLLLVLLVVVAVQPLASITFKSYLPALEVE